ncbi:sigma-54-dependent Fis family transcriptional regulator [Gordonia sp. (in: high G+C Gram-positive bacteria)]|uniref:sigma-54-dependent Fis family transcriptional regulator n=2 Tax=Gordonia sp. (in: high G+C Gram-positive bacteria) TaxID=84139 RepID=UPI0026287B40|nr:helix-turn-helix domain-containing protein [uncultured Gordonia sp.]
MTTIRNSGAGRHFTERGAPDGMAGAPGSARLPTYIHQSWDRSRNAGLAPDHVLSDLHYVPDLDLQRRLVQCAVPVLDRLHGDMSSIPLAIALTDENARVILRRDTDRSLAGRLDEACFAPGFDYSEATVGTNGVGTAVEARMPVYIDGTQHFNEELHEFTCAGTPIHDPVSGKLEGILDISCLARDANPMMRQLTITAARDIEAALRSSGSAKQLAVLNSFIDACRRRSGAVYSLSCGIFMSSGSQFLDPIDEAFLREEARCMLVPGRINQFTLILPSGQSIAIRRTLVDDAGEPAGVVLEVDLIKREASVRRRGYQVPTLPGAVGGSPQWERCRTELSRAAATSTNTLLVGERGAGRVTLARGAHLHKNPQARCAVVDCSSPDAVHDAEAALATSATTIVLRRIDALTPGDDAEIARAITDDQHSYPARWIVATTHCASDYASDDPVLTSMLIPLFQRTVEVPALRHHPEDIATILRLHAAQLAPNRDLEFSDGMLHALKKYTWPGNVSDLVATLKKVLCMKPAGVVTEADLPPYIHSAAPKRTITTLESAERDAIIETLRRFDGNRVKAAESLGISRSTLYRRINTYAIHL